MSGPRFYCSPCTSGKCPNVATNHCKADRKCKHDCANMARYSYSQVSEAVNQGASLVTGDTVIYLSDRDYDLINLVVNAALSALDNPSITLDDVIVNNYSVQPAEVRSWLD